MMNDSSSFFFRRPGRLNILQLGTLPLWAEILLAILIKLIVLSALWYAFFSHPQTSHMRLPTQKMEQHLLASADRAFADHLAGSAPAKAEAVANDKTPPALKDRHGTD
ncbi:cytochrome oxidase putative small subunit CydP [Undibacterium sp. Di26W]|uniref:cytochrome oxidase putative small subunit CydP n=1 Tax=Undibacterium sp. Di26W TaxID=3413035 RepID=UPI003BF1E77C